MEVTQFPLLGLTLETDFSTQKTLRGCKETATLSPRIPGSGKEWAPYSAILMSGAGWVLSSFALEGAKTLEKEGTCLIPESSLSLWAALSVGSGARPLTWSSPPLTPPPLLPPCLFHKPPVPIDRQ